MPEVEVKIWMALRSRIETRPFKSRMPAVYPATEFLPNNGDFLAVSEVISAPQRVLIKSGQKHTRTGQLILTLAHRLGLSGEVYRQEAASIAAHFFEGLRLNYQGVCVEITNSPQVQEGYRDNGYWRTPVVIPWRTFA